MHRPRLPPGRLRSRRRPRATTRRKPKRRARHRSETRTSPIGASMRGSVGNDGRGRAAVGISLLCILTLAGCADAFVGMSLPSLPKLDDVNPFVEKPVPLPGKRVSVIQQEKATTNLAAADKPILLPPQRQNDSWSQPG